MFIWTSKVNADERRQFPELLILAIVAGGGPGPAAQPLFSRTLSPLTLTDPFTFYYFIVAAEPRADPNRPGPSAYINRVVIKFHLRSLFAHDAS